LHLDSLCNGIGQFKQTARLLGPDEKVLGESSVDFQLKDMEVMATNVNLLGVCNSRNTGTITWNLLDDQLIIRYPLPVVKFQLPGQAAVQQTAACGIALLSGFRTGCAHNFANNLLWGLRGIAG
jgi:hypothetical protein